MFGDVLYVPGVGHFRVDASYYCDRRPTSQYLELVHNGIHGPMTICLHGVLELLV
jgi:hypothetical protein